jgi:acetolactate synthase small subunit
MKNEIPDNTTHQIIKRKLTLIKEAIDSWDQGELTAIATIIIVKRIATPKIPSLASKRWAKKVMKKYK